MGIDVRRVLSTRSVLIFSSVVTLVCAFALSHIVFASGEVFSVVSNKTTVQGQSVAVADMQVSGTGDDELTLKLYADNGSLQFGSSTGLTMFSRSDDGSSITATGPRSAINAALLTMDLHFLCCWDAYR